MLTFLLALLISAIPLPPKPAHYVTDNTGVLDANRRAELDEKLRQFERKTSDQVIVYVDKRVPEGTTLEEMGAQAVHEWGIGQKGKDNGAVLFLFTDDRKMRIEVGYGLEESLTDAKSRLITSTVMKPLLQAGDTTGAVEQGVDAILRTISGEPFHGSGRTAAETNTIVLSHGASMLVLGSILLVAVVMLVGALFLFIRTLIRNPRAAFLGGLASGGDSASSSGDSGGSGDFSGGGGDGGGGGASDSW